MKKKRKNEAYGQGVGRHRFLSKLKGSLGCAILLDQRRSGPEGTKDKTLLKGLLEKCNQSKGNEINQTFQVVRGMDNTRAQTVGADVVTKDSARDNHSFS